MFDSISEFAACIFYDRTGPLLFALMMLCTLVVAKVLLSMRGGVVLTFHFAPFTCPTTIPALAALPYSPSSLWLTTSEACYDAHSAAAMHVNEWLGKQQHALCPCHVAFVRLGRAWVAQVAGGLRVFCGSSCVAVGCAFVSGLAACECHPRAMVCVLAKHQLCDVHFSAVLVANDCLCDGRACLYAWGRVCRNGFQLEPGRAVAFCACAVGIALWHMFIRQCGFDATVRMKRLDVEHGFSFLVFGRVSCAELGLVAR